MKSQVLVSDEVASALADGQPVVALESTIFSNLGLPSPANAEALERCTAAIEQGGGVAAITAVIDGVPRAGLLRSEHDRILGEAHKTAERELPIAVAQKWPVGATTVSASLFIAANAGIRVFATGGIGGVHRGEADDVSADLVALASHRMVTVSAGAKNFLDLARTVERLETLGVPVLGMQTDWFPAFYARSSGVPIPMRVETPELAAAIAQAHFDLGRSGGVLVTVPIPQSEAIADELIDEAIERALRRASGDGLRGAAVTPYVLAAVAEATSGATLPANLSLAENNARVAVEIARSMLE
ncbi:MAG: pseudouridine-5'-phosphate glycosidase [Acidimicrobiales bacterium]